MESNMETNTRPGGENSMRSGPESGMGSGMGSGPENSMRSGPESGPGNSMGSGMEPMHRMRPPVREKKSRKKRLLLILLALLLVIGGGLLAFKLLMPRSLSQYEVDANALAGFLPGRTEEEIQNELNRIIEKGYFNVSINPTPVINTAGRVNLNIENVPANHYWMQVNVYLIDKAGKENLIYQSGIIKQGFHIEEVKAEGKLPSPGNYNGRADFSALQPDTQENIGQTSATMLITVQGKE